MGGTLEQKIRVQIETFFLNLPQVQAYSKAVEKINAAGNKKISVADSGSVANTEKLAASVDRLAESVAKLDDSKVGKLAKAFQFLSNVSNVLGHIKGTIEGVQFLLNLGEKFPAFGSKLSGAGTAIGGFFNLAKDKVVGAASVVKAKVGELVEDLPGMAKGLAGGASGLLGIGAAGAVATVGLVAIAGIIAAIVAAAVAIPAAVGALFKLAGSAAETGSKFHDLSQQTGVSVELLSSLAPAAEDSSGSIEELALGVGKFNKLIGEAARGSKEAIARLAEFGLTPQEALADTDAALEKVIQHILALPPGTQQAIAAQDAFGKSGAKLLPTLIATGGNIAELKKKAQELGVFWTGEGANAADEYGDKLNEMRRIVAGLANSLGQVLIPELLRLFRILTSEGSGAAETFGFAIRFIASQVHILIRALTVALALINTLRGKAGVGTSRAGGGTLGSGDGRFESNVGDGSIRANLRALDEIANTSAPSGPGGDGELDLSNSGGGGKGGGGKGSKIDSTLASLLGLDKARADFAFGVFKDLLDRETTALQKGLDERTISIDAYYQKLKELQIAQIDAELKNIGAQRLAQQKELADSLEQIKNGEGSDPEKEAKKTNELQKAQAALLALNERYIKLLRDRGEVATKTGAEEKKAIEDLRKEFVQLDEAAASFEGVQSIAAVVEKYRNIVEKLRAELSNPKLSDSQRESLEEQLKIALKLVNAETERVRVANLLAVVHQKNAIIDADINIIQAKHTGNIVEEYRARLLTKPLVEQQIANLEKALRSAEAMAESQQDPQTIEALKNQIAALEVMKRSYENLGTVIKNTLIDSTTAAFENLLLSMGEVIAGTKSVVDAFKSFALQIIKEIERVIAKMIALKIVTAILKAISKASGGDSDVGGGIAGLGGGAADGFAAGGDITARAGGRLINVAEGGHDELVVSTDPKFGRRTAQLLGRFIRRTGILPKFSEFNSGAILGNISARIPSLGAGDWVPATAGGPPASDVGVQNINVTMNLPGVRDHRDFQANKQAILRDAARAVANATKRSRG
jgi:lambda family phage tail tape measure protein